MAPLIDVRSAASSRPTGGRLINQNLSYFVKMRRLTLPLIFLVTVGCSGDASMEPSMPVVHEAPLPGYPSAIEYFLPQPEMLDDVRGSLPPWIQEIVASPQSNLACILEQRLRSIELSDLKPLCEQLRSYTPTSVIVREDKKCWLRLDSQHSSENVGSSVYLPPPPDEQRIRRQLDSIGFSASPVFSVFAMNFAGLAEDFGSSGNFLGDDEEWSTLSEEWQEEIIDNFQEWRGSLVFYHARNGDQLLLHRDGHVGWWKFAEGHVTREFDSFSAFIRFYVNYRDDNPWPLDSYGPP